MAGHSFLYLTLTLPDILLLSRLPSALTAYIVTYSLSFCGHIIHDLPASLQVLFPLFSTLIAIGLIHLDTEEDIFNFV